jgi:hypothetical protein
MMSVTIQGLRRVSPRAAAPAAALGALLVLALAAPGCGSSGPEMARVRGKVTVKGRPLTKGTITFVSPDEKRPNASSQIGADGSYDLQTTEPGDGAQLGDYKVIVSDVDTAQILDYIPKKKMPEPKKTIAPKYSSTDTTDLKATVRRGSNNVPFDLEPGSD